MAKAARFWLGSLFGVALSGVLGVSHAQEPTPVPEATGTTTPAAEAPALPEPLMTPLPTPPESTAPDLLPETNALPQPRRTPAPNPFDLLPGGPVPQGTIPPTTESSAGQKIKDAIRFREIRTLAERDPYAISLQYYAGRAATFEDRRQYLRLYYHYLGARMRRLEPRLAGMINGFEWGQVGLMTQANIRRTIPLRELDKRKANAKNARASQ